MKVEKKEWFKTDPEDEWILLEPQSLYLEILALVDTYKVGWSFVRPSGTEDILRIYAEGETLDKAIQLANQVKDLIQEKYFNADS